MSASRPQSGRAHFTSAGLSRAITGLTHRRLSPCEADLAGAGIGLSLVRELAVELGRNRPAIAERKLRPQGRERQVLRRRRAVDDEVRAGQRLEYCGERRI